MPYCRRSRLTYCGVSDRFFTGVQIVGDLGIKGLSLEPYAGWQEMLAEGREGVHDDTAMPSLQQAGWGFGLHISTLSEIREDFWAPFKFQLTVC